MTSNNVKFLIKTPIVGIKIFDGDNLKKRLQLTFESEGNFNVFSNKIRHWLGVNVQMSSGIPGSTPSNSQIVPHLGSSQVPDSVSIAESASQNMLPSNMALSFPFQPSQSQVPIAYPARDPLRYPTYDDPFSLLLGAAESAMVDGSQFSQQDGFTQLSQVSFQDALQTSIFSGQQDLGKSGNTEVLTDYSQVITREEINKALEDISRETSEKRKQTLKKRRRNHKRESLAELMTDAIKEIVETKDNSLHDLSDQELSLKLARTLKSKRFKSFARRIETLLQSLPEPE